MPKIMIIRHAEKHYDGSPDRGVSIEGIHKKHELTVRGWQRAGALVRFFAPPGDHPPGGLISTPRAIFASAAVPNSPSLRAQRTVEPLAAALGLPINTDHPEGAEAAVAAAVLAAPSPVLISWHHSHISLLVKAIAGDRVGSPKHWPDDRFDVVWILERDDAGGPWFFAQVPQRLFAHDHHGAI
jgi:hypothetical protein